MSSNQHKRSASPSGDRDSRLNKRQRKNNEEEASGSDEKQRAENQLDEKEEKKEREVKEDLNAPALPLTDPDLVVGTVDKDLICAICFCLLSHPEGSFSLLASLLPCFHPTHYLLFCRIQVWACFL
jgi:hypothetical protein